MRRVRVNVGKVAMVYKDGDFQRVLTEGVYWIAFNESVKEEDMSLPFNCSEAHLNLLLRNKQFAALTKIVDVGDDEIVIKYIRGKFNSVLATGRYVFWKGLVEYSFTSIDLSKKEITEDISKRLFMKRDFMDYIRVYVVESFEKGVLEVDGKVESTLDAGTYFYWKTSEQIRVSKVDLRTQQLEVLGQEILTKDKAALRINFYSQYKVVDLSLIHI